VGGIAVGTISFGGLALGGLTLAGLAVGMVAVGGLSAGLVALGGAAFGWTVATGGLAVAREFAIGGVAVGAHANDEAARQFLQQRGLHVAVAVVRHARWMWLLVLVPIIIGLRSAQEDAPTPGGRAT
jgi:hypothetical protein